MAKRIPQIKPFPWAGSNNPDYARYMREEWGVPVHEDRRHFEMLSLDIFQAGLSWAIVLRKRQSFRRAFANWQIKIGRAHV